MNHVRSAAWTAGTILVVVLLYFGISRLRSVDPFEAYKSAFNSVSQNPSAVTLSDVDVSTYDSNGVALAKMHVNLIDVQRDERHVDLMSVDNGLLFDKGKQAAKFSAGLVKWDANSKSAQVSEVARIVTNGLDVKTMGLSWDEPKGQILLPMPIVGTLGNGAVYGKDAAVYLRAKAVEVSNASWVGKVKYAPQDQEKPRDRKVRFRAQRIKKLQEPDTISYTNAEMLDDEDTFVRANSIVHNQKTDMADCVGSCQMRSPRMDLTGEKALVDLNVKKATITEGIRMTLYPKPGDVLKAKEKPKEDEEQDPIHNRRIAKGYPVVATCDKIEYLYGDERQAILTGHVKARQELPEGKWRELTADRAVIDEQKETLHLEGHVHMTASNGDDARFEWIDVSTKEDDDSYEAGPGDATFVVPKKQADKIPTGPPKKDGGGEVPKRKE